MARVKSNVMIQLDEDSFIKNDTLGYVLFLRKTGKREDDEDEEEVEEVELDTTEKPTPEEKEFVFRKTYHNKVSHAIIAYMNNKRIESSELEDYVKRLEEIEKRILAVDFTPLTK